MKSGRNEKSGFKKNDSECPKAKMYFSQFFISFLPEKQ